MFRSLDFLYVPTDDVDDTARRYVEALGATLVWKVRAFGTVVACLQVSGDGPAVLLSGHLEGTTPILVYRVDDYATAVERLREPLQVAHAAVRLSPMFLEASEVTSAARSFAAKFTDILHRRRVLFGPDPFAGLTVPREAARIRLEQELLNLVLRLRAAYALRSLREEQLALLVADAAGPLRSCAFTLLELEGRAASSPREDGVRAALQSISRARETRALPPGVAGPTLFAMIELAQAMRGRVERLS
jgi:hypothetical protein